VYTVAAVILSMLAAAVAASSTHLAVSPGAPSRETPLGRAFALLAACVAVWAFAYAFEYAAPDDVSFFAWYRISAFGWCPFVAVILYFTLAFKGKLSAAGSGLVLTTAAFSALCLLVQETSTLFVVGRRESALGNVEVVDARRIGYYLFGIPSLAILSWSMVKLSGYASRPESGKQSRLARGVLALIIVILIPGLQGNMMLFAVFGVASPSFGVFSAYVTLAGIYALAARYRRWGADDIRRRIVEEVDEEVLIVGPDGELSRADRGGGRPSRGLDAFFSDSAPLRAAMAESKASGAAVEARVPLLATAGTREVAARVVAIFDGDDHEGWIVLLKGGENWHQRLEESRLTAQERGVVAFLLEGLTTKEIASQMRLSPGTVKNYTSSVFRKTGARGRGDLMHRLLKSR
jgi:DNA-binding CsgD family transcriptional regulator